MHSSATAVWPPTGIALAAVLLLGYRVAPAIFIGAFLVNITTAGSLVSSLGIASGNTPEALAGAFLVNRYGLELVQRLQPDVVLLDIGLPGLDGYEVARRLKSAQICPRLVAITVMAALKTMSGR